MWIPVHKYSVPVLLLASVLAGSAIAVQAPINAQLRLWLRSPWSATSASLLISFLVGMIALAVVLLISPTPAPRLADVSASPWWVWLGGVLGAYYVLASIIATPRIGPVLFFGLIVTGQLLTSLLLEHYAWFGLERHPISIGRMFGVLLLLAGTVLIRAF